MIRRMSAGDLVQYRDNPDLWRRLTSQQAQAVLRDVRYLKRQSKIRKSVAFNRLLDASAGLNLITWIDYPDPE